MKKNMEKEKRYFALFSCDEWKSYKSQRLIGVFDESNLKKIVAEKIKDRDFELNIDKEVEESSIWDLKNCLEYAYIEEIKLNKEI